MEVEFDDVQTSVCFAPNNSRLLCAGYIDGRIELYNFNPETQDLEVKSKYALKKSVRNVAISPDNVNVYATSQNRALTQLDAETGQKTRCIIKAHEGRPSAMLLLSSMGSQMLATGDEDGQVKTWDLRANEPLALTFTDQEDVINDMNTEGPRLLAASSDGTLGTYELRKGKFKTKSELMHDELLSVVCNKKFCYVGSGDGSLEIFHGGEYGNIIERFETKLPSVDTMLEVRRGLLMVASGQSPIIRILHVDPNKLLSPLGEHGTGVDKLLLSDDRRWLISSSMVDQTIKVWDIEAIVQKIPVLTAKAAKKQKGKSVDKAASSFWDDLAQEDEDDDMDSD